MSWCATSTGRRSSLPGNCTASYPAILKDEKIGAEAIKLYNDAQAMLKQILNGRLFKARGVVGLFAANSVNDDDIEVYVDDTRRAVAATLHTLRQQDEKPAGKPNRALADFVAPKQTGRKDYIGGFAVSIHGVDDLAKQHERRHDDYRAIMVKALADRLAEAFAERLHERVRREFWGYGSAENLTNDALIREEYKGIRPAPGYPACPDHTEKAALFSLVEATAKNRREAHRELRHVAGGGGQRVLLLAPGVAVLCGRKTWARPSRGLRAPQRHGPGDGREMAVAESGVRTR